MESITEAEHRCPEGHTVGLGDVFCPACGTPTKALGSRWVPNGADDGNAIDLR